MMHSFEVERFFDIKHVGLLSSAEVYLLNLKIKCVSSNCQALEQRIGVGAWSKMMG